MLYTMPIDKFLNQIVTPLRKGVRTGLAVSAITGLLSRAAQAQDKAPAPNLVVTTNSLPSLTWQTKMEPSWAWGPRTQVSGLFVDLLMPQRSWVMLNPPRQARDLSGLTSRYPLPMAALLPMNGNQELREPNFALLRFRF